MRSSKQLYWIGGILMSIGMMGLTIVRHLPLILLGVAAMAVIVGFFLIMGRLLIDI